MEVNDEDPFESLLFIEQRLQEEGYREGHGHGVAEGLKEAVEAGKANGQDVAWEIGYYLGFAQTWLRLLRTKPEPEEKKTKVLSALVGALQSFKILDIESTTEYRKAFSLLQAKYKQALALLKVPTAVKAKADLSF